VPPPSRRVGADARSVDRADRVEAGVGVRRHDRLWNASGAHGQLDLDEDAGSGFEEKLQQLDDDDLETEDPPDDVGRDRRR
jgi:hypothetical protein